MQIDNKSWDLVAEDKELHYNRPKAAYLHKKRDLLSLVRRWAGDRLAGARIIKTDLMEESVRPDDVLFDLSSEVRKAIGMDISFKLTSLARARPESDNRQIEYVVSDARYLSFKDNAFDIVLSNSTLDHFPEIDLGIKEAFRILKPGGIMIITIHNKLEFTFYLYHVFKKMFNISPHFHFEKTYLPCEIREKLLRFGFIIEDSSTTTHMPMGLWSILFAFVVVAERFGKRAEKIANNLVSFIVKTLEALERRYTVLNYFISLLIAFKVRKPENSLS